MDALLALLAGRFERVLQDVGHLREDVVTDFIQREVIDEGLTSDPVADIECGPVGTDTLIEEVGSQVARVDALSSGVREPAVQPRYLATQVLLDDDATSRAPVQAWDGVPRHAA